MRSNSRAFATRAATFLWFLSAPGLRSNAAGARPAPAHAGPAEPSLQDAEAKDLEILVVRARLLARKASAVVLLCEGALPRRAMGQLIFRHNLCLVPMRRPTIGFDL